MNVNTAQSYAFSFVVTLCRTMCLEKLKVCLNHFATQFNSPVQLLASPPQTAQLHHCRALTSADPKLFSTPQPESRTAGLHAAAALPSNLTRSF